MQPRNQSEKSLSHYGSTALWLLILLLSVTWWRVEGQNLFVRTILLAALSLASFMVGCLVGFLFTSYGEEAGTVGKVRDWLIGGITGLTIAKAGSVQALLKYFQATTSEGDFALAVSAAVVYSALGFFFMFFYRELIFNVLLAKGRAERSRIDGTRQAGQVVKSFLLKLPASLLSGVDDVDDIGAVDEEEAQKLRNTLYASDVNAFLEEAEKNAADCGSLDWDVVSKVAYIHYYRTYFEKDDKQAQATRAIEWITRALFLNPQHADLTLKLADMTWAAGDAEDAATILENLIRRPDASMIARQWLGLFLLNVPGRLRDAIHYSEDYRKLFGEDTDSLFNIACAYAQSFCDGNGELGTAEEARKQALEYLRQALKRDPDYAETVRTKWIEPGESFACFGTDNEFRALVGLDKDSANTTG